jgi:hypothetical protein
MHTIGKHGPEVPDSVMRQRPIGGALTRKIRNMPQYDGVDGRDNPIVRVGSKNGGRGYKPNKKDPQPSSHRKHGSSRNKIQ